MKTVLTKKFILKNCDDNNACYTDEEVLALLKGRKSVTIQDFLKARIPIEDKYWFICYSDILSVKEKSELLFAIISQKMKSLNKVKSISSHDGLKSTSKFFEALKTYLASGKKKKEELESALLEFDESMSYLSGAIHDDLNNFYNICCCGSIDSLEIADEIYNTLDEPQMPNFKAQRKIINKFFKDKIEA